MEGRKSQLFSVDVDGLVESIDKLKYFDSKRYQLSITLEDLAEVLSNYVLDSNEDIEKLDTWFVYDGKYFAEEE